MPSFLASFPPGTWEACFAELEKHALGLPPKPALPLLPLRAGANLLPSKNVPKPQGTPRPGARILPNLGAGKPIANSPVAPFSANTTKVGETPTPLLHHVEPLLGGAAAIAAGLLVGEATRDQLRQPLPPRTRSVPLRAAGALLSGPRTPPGQSPYGGG